MSLGLLRRALAFLACALLALARPSRAARLLPAIDAGAIEDLLPVSEDVPVHAFETTVVTVGKASGKEKRQEKPAFFLRGDDPAAAATRFVYLHALPLEHVPHFAGVFAAEYASNVPEEHKPRAAASRRPPRAPLAPLQYLERGLEHAADGRDDEAHFDFARALMNAAQPSAQQQRGGDDANHPGTSSPPPPNPPPLSPDDRRRAEDALREHHRAHSRRLNAAEKVREQRQRAHEREVRVARSRVAAYESVAETLADFEDAWADATRADADSNDGHIGVVRRAIDRLTTRAEGGAEGAGEDGTTKEHGARSLRALRAFADAVARADWAAVIASRAALPQDPGAAFSHAFVDGNTDGADDSSDDADASGSSGSSSSARSLSAIVHLAASRASFALGRWRDAERHASACVHAGRTNGDWRRGQTRAVALALGASAALERGDADAFLKFAAVAKRRDPDTPLLKAPYAAIKSAERLLKEADNKLDRGESRDAMDAAEDAAAALRSLGAGIAARLFLNVGDDEGTPEASERPAAAGNDDEADELDADATLDDASEWDADAVAALLVGASSDAASAARDAEKEAPGAMFAGVDARRCRALAQTKAIEAALVACAAATRALGCDAGESGGTDESGGTGGGSSGSSSSGSSSAGNACSSSDARTFARVLMARAETHARDQYPSGALADYRAAADALESSANSGHSESARMLLAAREGAADAEREKRRHEGDERDHAKMLDLPENLGELDKERRCEFVKKAYKKAALRWHPDKAQSAAGKVRAARKMNEMTEARDHVSERLGCVAPKNNGDERGGHPGGGHTGGGHPGGGYRFRDARSQHDAFHQRRAYEEFYRRQQQQRRREGGGGRFQHSWEF